ncbi:MAG: hypothetical protein KC434_08675, partial [Anaerolineales bacterium]|nr:hypothetical protein [Anaerolineales bacterium]
ELALAEENMQEALRLRFELNQATHHLLPPQLGLAYIAHLNKSHDKAQAGLELVMAELSAQTMDGLGDPFGFYWLCYTLLDYYQDSRTAQFIADAHKKLQAQANKIPGLESRESFLQNVPENRLIGETYRRISPQP